MDWQQYIKPELLIGIPVLIIIGKIIKDSNIKSKFIPSILGIISVVFGIFYTLIMTETINTAQGILSGIIQGILIAGMAVYGNQIFKQYTEKE